MFFSLVCDLVLSALQLWLPFVLVLLWVFCGVCFFFHGDMNWSIICGGPDGGWGLVFTVHLKFSPLFISLKFWVIH